MYRYLRYGRVTDIETFRIILEKGSAAKFRFDGIYSNEHNIEHDNIHGDKPENGKLKTHRIKYYFNDEKHPIVFINTANHAMSYHDTNHKIWKWEYVPWEEDSAVVYGEKPRREVDRFFGQSNSVRDPYQRNCMFYKMANTFVFNMHSYSYCFYIQFFLETITLIKPTTLY